MIDSGKVDLTVGKMKRVAGINLDGTKKHLGLVRIPLGSIADVAALLHAGCFDVTC